MSSRLRAVAGLAATLFGSGTIPSMLAQSFLAVPAVDAGITESAPDNNLGAAWLAAGTDQWGLRSRSLLAFGLPAGQFAVSLSGVRLVLAVTQAPAGSVGNVEFSLHRVVHVWFEGCLGFPASDDWGDLSAECPPPDCVPCVTWLNFASDWSQPGGSPRFDYEPVASGKAQLTGNALTFENQAGMRQDVQHWLNGASNYGWILMASDEGRRNTLRRFGSREDALKAPRLTVFYTSPPPVPPVIEVGPRDTWAATGGNAPFTVVASGTAPLAYQWYRNGLAIELARSDMLILQNLTKDRAGTYSVRVSNAAGAALSGPASLSVLDPPAITAHPAGRLVKRGEAVELAFAANGDELAYQWLHNGQILSGATDTVLHLDSFQPGDAGIYVARATNRVGVAQTLPATLTLVRAPVIERMRYEAGEVRFEFQVQAGVPCVVEYSDSLAVPDWRRLIRVSSPQTPMLFPVRDVPGASQRYYRVLAE